jgi:uncharacterized membrane protein YjgN (DUF898 family)
VKPRPSKIMTTGIIKLPTPNAMLCTKPNNEYAFVLRVSSDFSASKALAEAAKAASETPSTNAAINKITIFVVNAKTAIIALAIIFPIMYILFRPYLSAATPNGILATKVDTPITVMIRPIRGRDNP